MKQDTAQIKEAALSSYAVFARLFQDDGWFDDVHELLCKWLQKRFIACLREVEEKGYTDGKILVIMPRGSLKSTIVTKYFPAWATLYMYYKYNDSSLRSLITGNTFTNAKKKMGNIRSLFEVDLFKTLFPEVLPKKGRDGNKWSDESAEINREGAYEESTFECAGTNTKLTGRHYNILIEDDTTAPDADEMKIDMTMPSRDTIEKAIGFHKASFPLFVPKGLRFNIVVSTRWAMQDLVEYVQTEENFYVFNMPAKKPDGSSSFSCFYQGDVLAEIEKRVGSFMFHMLYLNQPQDPSTRIFNPDLWQYIKKKDVPQEGYYTIALDPAISGEEEACESSITVNQHRIVNGKRYEYWHKDENGKYLPFQLCQKMLQIADRYDTPEVPVKELIVEANAYQLSLKYILENLMVERAKDGGKTYHITTFKSGSKSGKDLRIRSLQPGFEQKRIYFVSETLSDQTESQLKQYPNGMLVDTIDSWSMHRMAWRKDWFDSPVIDNSPPENSFEAACEEIRKRYRGTRLGLHTGLENDMQNELFGLEMRM